MKLMNKFNRKIWIMIVISMLLSMYFYPSLPVKIPNQFNIQGEIIGTTDKIVIFLFPVLMIVLLFASELMRKIDPKHINYEKFEGTYYMFQFGMAIFMICIQIFLIASAMGWIHNLPSMANIMLGAMFIFLGNITPKIKYNYSMGIKTPWTLASEKVWYLTHRTCGKIWVLAGLLMLPLGLLAGTLKEILLAAIIIIAVFSSYFLSYYYYQKENV